MRSWRQYLDVEISHELVATNRKGHSGSFDSQFKALQELRAALQPRNIVCLGSGALNDIPIRDFIQSRAHVTLVDWVDDLTRKAFSHLLLEPGKTDAPACLAQKAGCDPRDVCASYTESRPDSPGLCANARMGCAGGEQYCSGFVASLRPVFLRHDVTGGVAESFAAKVPPIVESSDNLTRCFKKAIEALKVIKAEAPLPIETGSSELVVTSMVISQFKWEPYLYFERQAAIRFLREFQEGSDELKELARRLRAGLFEAQLKGHLAEIARIANKTCGRVFLSVEMLSESADHRGFEPLPEQGLLIQEISRHFLFEFDTLPPPRALDWLRVDASRSISQSYVLRPREQA